jgi:acetyl-CoA carboxylase biotin carboxylase subunit
MFTKILIANRGEIACRVARACRELGVRSVAVYSDADRDALHARSADEAVHIGPAPARESYLNPDRIIAAARETGAEAIHPGYGFLSEKAEFAARCEKEGIVFIGPPAQAIARMGGKAAARATVKAAGVPVVPGSEGVVPDLDAARAAAAAIGYPLLVKAAAGGGGIGMAVAKDDGELEKSFRACSDRAASAFGDPSVYLERWFPAPRHVEVQVFGDLRGTLVHLFERECSIQRRHQKVVEEAPAPALAGNAPLAERMYSAALAAARAAGYTNAGTVEFLVADGAFHFIEMNTRLQVEHPITELTTGLDLVQLQLRVAAGEKLGFTQSDIRRRGHAIECRIYAENPDKGFIPSPGKIARWDAPSGEGLRVDAGYETGGTVTPYYDPLLAKLIAFGDTREAAVARAEQGLARFSIEGVKTNIALHRRILASEAFREGRLDTHFLDRLPASR